MAIESPASANLEGQRAELEQVLCSELFRRAPILTNLLSYLCEKLFAGDASQIKEYSIGVEVFHRGVSFDQDSDSIVRVEVNRLRKRLAEYYSGPGASHHLRIAIPVGKYIPEFQVLSLSESDISTAKNVEVVADEKTSAGLYAKGGKRLILWVLSYKTTLVVLLGALVIVVAFTTVLIDRHKTEERQAIRAVPAGSASATDPVFGLPHGQEIRILSGANRSYVDHAGKMWNADAYFSGGDAVKSPVQHIWRTQDPSFYRSSRQGQFRYDIPLKSGLYELHLHFAETVYGPESTGNGGEGSRVLAVSLNGVPLLKHFDIVADAGGSRTADVKVFPNIAPSKDGYLHLEFSGESGSQASLSGIELLPGVRGRIRPIRILARQSPYYSNDSQWWSPDNYFEGGQLSTYLDPVSGTEDPELYEGERWGNFSYAIPVAAGRYSLTLYFALRHPSPSSEYAESEHVFNVFCNGRAILENFDLKKEARNADVVVRKVVGLEPNAQGKLVLSFVPVKGYATVTGIEVLPQ